MPVYLQHGYNISYTYLVTFKSTTHDICTTNILRHFCFVKSRALTKHLVQTKNNLVDLLYNEQTKSCSDVTLHNRGGRMGSGATDTRTPCNNDSRMVSVKRSTIFKPRLSCLVIVCSAFLLASYLTPIWDILSADLGQYGHRLRRSKGLVTLFTTFDDNKEKYAIRLNVLRNWSLMRPEANLILFIQESQQVHSLHKLVTSARFLGWAVLPVHRLSQSGKPFIKELYYEAMEQYDTPLYGFVSGDILFDDGLLKTLRLIKAESPFIGPTLVIGRRQNAFVDKDKVVYEYVCIYKY